MSQRSRLRTTIAALQDRLSQTVETVSRSSQLQTAGTGIEDLDPPEDIDEYHDLYRTTGIVRANINQFVRDVTEPGARVQADDDATQAYFMGGDDAPDGAPAGGFIKNCAVIAGEKRQPFYPLLQSSIIQKWTRGTTLVEYLKDDPDDIASPITGFKQIRPETVSARTYENQNVLVDPEDTDADVETTRRGEAAAYVQFDDQSILGRRIGGFDDKETIPLSQNDVLKQVLDPDIGGTTADEEGVFGTSIMEAIAEDVEEYEETKRDRFRAIKTKAWGIWEAEFNTEVTEAGNEVILQEWDESEQDEWLNEVDDLAPGEILGHDGSIDLNKFEGEVPDLGGTLQHYVDDILGPLPAPKYATAHGEDITQHVTGEQGESYTDLIREERQAQARDWTQAMRLVAERHPDLDPSGVELVLEPEEDDSPVLSLDQDEVDRLKTYAEALDLLAGPTQGPGTLVEDDTLRELIAQLPEDAQPDTEQPLDEDDANVEAQFDAAFGGDG